jgi:hypothetical protein
VFRFQVSASGLSDGLAIAEALVQIEPSVFTPAWFAGNMCYRINKLIKKITIV